jgi:hypothetical protein
MKLFERPSTGLSDSCQELLSSCPISDPFDPLPLFRKHWMFHNIIDHAYKLGCAKKDTEMKVVKTDLDYYKIKCEALQTQIMFYRNADSLLMLVLLICIAIGIASGLGAVWLTTHRNLLP